MTLDTTRKHKAISLVAQYNAALPHRGSDPQSWADILALLRENLDMLKEVAASLPADSTDFKQFESAITAAENLERDEPR